MFYFTFVKAYWLMAAICLAQIMMNGRYLIVKNKKEEDLIYNIAEFLWNTGNEVILQGNFWDDEYYHRFLAKNPWIILVDESDFLHTETGIKNKAQQTDHIIIHFSATGVYTNAIPFPHRIFEFEQLDQTEVNRFFHWCMRLNLFSDKNEAVHRNRNIFSTKNIPIGIL